MTPGEMLKFHIASFAIEGIVFTDDEVSLFERRARGDISQDELWADVRRRVNEIVRRSK